MKMLYNLALIAALAAAPATAFAQATPTPTPPAVPSAPGFAAIADLGGAVRQSAAFRTASQQIQTQFKAQIDAYNARANPLQQELQKAQADIQALQRAAGTTPATLQQRVTAFQTRQEAIERELAPLAAPFERPLAYAQEQVAQRLDQAVRNAMTAKRVTVLVNPQAVAFALPTANITADIVAQLNTLVRTVSITPPAGWQPGQAAQQPAPAQPQGR